MFSRRRFARPCALALAIAAVAAPAAQARGLDPRLDPPEPVSAEPAPPVVREVHSGDDQTVALVLSGAALLVAAAGAGLAGRTQRRVGRIAHQ